MKTSNSLPKRNSSLSPESNSFWERMNSSGQGMPSKKNFTESSFRTSTYKSKSKTWRWTIRLLTRHEKRKPSFWCKSTSWETKKRTWSPKQSIFHRASRHLKLKCIKEKTLLLNWSVRIGSWSRLWAQQPMARDMRCILQSRQAMLSTMVLFSRNSRTRVVPRTVELRVERRNPHAGALPLNPKLLSGKHTRHWKNITNRHRDTLQVVTTKITTTDMIWIVTKSSTDLSMNTKWRMRGHLKKSMISKISWPWAKAEETSADRPERINNNKSTQRASRVGMAVVINSSAQTMQVHNRRVKGPTDTTTHTGIKAQHKDERMMSNIVFQKRWGFLFIGDPIVNSCWTV